MRKEYEKIIKTSGEIVRDEIGMPDSSEKLSNLILSTVKNDIIEKIDIIIEGHFGNCPSLDMLFKNNNRICGYVNYNIGHILSFLIDFFDRTDDNGVSFKTLEGTPVRLIFDDSKVIAIGHFMKDRFVLITDLMKLEVDKG